MMYMHIIVETWKTFGANELTHSAAHHLHAIQELGAEYGGWARVSDIARRLGITRGSVSINLRALKKRGLVVADEHRMVRLSSQGRHIADNVAAKGATVTAFLTGVLGVTPAQATIDSCKIEHLISYSTGHQLVHFTRFLTSADPLAREVLKRFRRFQDKCPEPKTCPLCQSRCLVEKRQPSGDQPPDRARGRHETKPASH
jgi:DtxR family transcriptional regulator, Mn-dependent transcriptional regulator